MDDHTRHLFLNFSLLSKITALVVGGEIWIFELKKNETETNYNNTKSIPTIFQDVTTFLNQRKDFSICRVELIEISRFEIIRAHGQETK